MKKSEIVKPKKIKVNPADEFDKFFNKIGIGFQKEIVVNKLFDCYYNPCERRFRCDFVLQPKHLKIVIEFEGGAYQWGGHSRGKGYTSNTDKYNMLAINGYIVLRYTIAHLYIPKRLGTMNKRKHHWYRTQLEIASAILTQIQNPTCNLTANYMSKLRTICNKVIDKVWKDTGMEVKGYGAP